MEPSVTSHVTAMRLRTLSRFILCLMMISMFAGCSPAGRAVSKQHAQTESKSAPGGSRFLAYEHTIYLDTDPSKIPTVQQTALNACRQAAADLCTVLVSRVSSGRNAEGFVKLRAKPAAIGKLIAALGEQGEITSKSTTAEDLAVPIEDAAKKRDMLLDYRTKLEALRGRASSDVDALIKVNRALAETQAQLEAITGQHAHLMQRVETEILNINIGTEHNASFWRPIGLAFSDFGTNLSQGIASAIMGLAILIPWCILFGILAWIARKIWRRRARRTT